MYSYMCTKYTCAHLCEEAGSNLGLTVFFFNIFFFPGKENKRCDRHTKNSNPYGFELRRPSIKGTKLLFKVIKAIIIILRSRLPHSSSHQASRRIYGLWLDAMTNQDLWAMCSGPFFSWVLYQFINKCFGAKHTFVEKGDYCDMRSSVVVSITWHLAIVRICYQVNITACRNVIFVLCIVLPKFSLNSEFACSGNPDLLWHYDCCFSPIGLHDVRLRHMACAMCTKWS